MAFHPILFLYSLLQRVIIFLFSPAPPQRGDRLPGPRIAVIGAGLTGVSSAAHCVGHGSDVVIFESSDKVGGIWARVNSASGLQIHSIMYRFHPSVDYAQKDYPKRDAILAQIRGVWKRYGLDAKTRFNTPVETVRKGKKGKWVINGDTDNTFDGVIAAVGTCGVSRGVHHACQFGQFGNVLTQEQAPKIPHVPGLENFKGEKVHSSQLDGVDMKGKNVIVIGGGASAIEVLEYASAHKAAVTNLLSRSDKWIIPRNPLVDALLSMNIFGMELYTSFIPEFLLRRFFYRDLKDLAPTSGQGLWESTPMVNDDVLDQIRAGKARWLRGDLNEVQEKGVVYNLRSQGVPKGGPGKEIFVPADIVVFATGFQRPSLSFLPDDVFEEPYAPPNWYLQTFPPEHISVCCNNCTSVP